MKHEYITNPKLQELKKFTSYSVSEKQLNTADS